MTGAGVRSANRFEIKRGRLTISLLYEHRLQAEVNNVGQILQPGVRFLNQRLKTFISVVLQWSWNEIFHVCAFHNNLQHDDEQSTICASLKITSINSSRRCHPLDDGLARNRPLRCIHSSTPSVGKCRWLYRLKLNWFD